MSPQLAKQVEVLNPSLQSVLFHPQIIFMALFCTGSIFIIPLMCVDGLSPSSPGAGVTSLPWASPLLEHLGAELASSLLTHIGLCPLNPGRCWHFGISCAQGCASPARPLCKNTREHNWNGKNLCEVEIGSCPCSAPWRTAAPCAVTPLLCRAVVSQLPRLSLPSSVSHSDRDVIKERPYRIRPYSNESPASL